MLTSFGVATQSFVGIHLWHIVLLAGWAPVFGIIVLVQRRRNLHPLTTDAPLDARPSPSHGLTEEAAEHEVPWCQAMALGSVCAALVHVAVMPNHFSQSAWYGSFFLLAAIGQLVFAVAVVARPTRGLVLAGVTACALTVVLWLFSRFVGVPIGPDNGATEPFGALDTFASVAELVVVAFGMLALRTRRITAPSWRWSAWSPSLRLAAPLCVAGTVALSLLASRS